MLLFVLIYEILVVVVMCFFFFFSSRRRHTRSKRDWSSDVCSSDLVVIGGEYNFGSPAWTNQGAIYDPIADIWTSLDHPAGWDSVGDAQCAVMPDGDRKSVV